MTRALLALLPLLMAASAAVVDAAPAGDANPLAAEQWKTRPLVVVVARSADDPMVVEVRRSLSTSVLRDAFAEREMVLYTVIGGEARRNDAMLPGPQAAALLGALALSADGPAEAVLVGKDGGVKLRQRGRVDFGELLRAIDAMPMRQR